jgi:predicted XRE-type DNA-binding protein
MIACGRRETTIRNAMAKRAKRVETGSGNVFKGLGFADADERKLKVQLAMRLQELIEETGYTQAQLVGVFAIAQPHVSELANYRLNRFSSERLLHFITLLDRDVETVIRPKAAKRRKGTLSVLVAA